MQGASFKNTYQERKAFIARIVAASVIVCILIGVLLTQLIQLQTVQHEYFVTRADENRIRALPIPGVRGLIFDRHGTVLAENLPAYRLEVVPEQTPDLLDTVERLARIIDISEADKERFLARAEASPAFDQIPIRLNLSTDEVALFEVDRQSFPGVSVRAGLTRHYPLGTTVAHLIGYVGGITARDMERVDAELYRGHSYIGKTGIERQYESLLHGRPGSRLIETNAVGRRLRELDYTRPTPGQNLYLTLDASLQLVAEQALDGLNGAVVALDVHSGEVLAMVSLPSYDPTPFVDGISHKAYHALTTDQSRPLFHRAIQGQYPPGSTIKPIMGLAGLEHEIFSPSTRVFCPGYYQLPDSTRRHRDWKRQGHNSVDLHEAVAQSCDVYFYDLAHRLEVDRIHDFLAQFGLGEPTGIDLPNANNGLLPSRAWKRAARNESWYPGETLNIGIGQGFMLTTPLQLAVATARLASHGRGARPHLLHRVHDVVSDQSRANPPTPWPAITLKDSLNWKRSHDSMVAVVHGPTGTAKRMGETLPYRMAGKTGTAQVAGLSQEDDQAPQLSDVPYHLRDHSLFIGYAPADAPRIAVAVIAEHSGSGSAVAAPIARQVIDHALGHAQTSATASPAP